jgi:hypothetical protein
MNPLVAAAKWIIDEATRFVSPTPVAMEWVIAAAGTLLVALVPWGPRLERLRTAFHWIANRKRTAIVISGFLPVAVRLSMLGMVPVPEPSIHDEFSHLLLADTMAHGRLANPTHPMWRHFESIHIIQQPTYSSMYPPAQGAMLAFGEKVFDEPWAGVVVAVGLMCMAVCWMMQGWLPPAWAFYGALIVGLKIGIVGLWMNSYFAAAVPAIGGALLIGSLPRLRVRQTGVLPPIFLGLGMVILMNSRPFDGALLTAVALAYVTPGLLREKRLIATITPAAAVLACGLLMTGYYNWRVTGSPVRMAYQVNRDTYGWPENLAFLKPKKVNLRDPVLKKMYVKEVTRREMYQDPAKLLDDYITRLFDNWTFFIGPVLSVPLLFLPWIFRERRTRPLIIFFGAIAALNLFQLVLYPYHLAPLVAVMFVIVTQGVRHLYVMAGRTRAGMMALVLPACLIMVAALKQNAGDLGLRLAYWERAEEWHADARAYISAWLSRRPGKQLVLVRYSRFHEVNQEWVYNDADIDGSKIVWAREVNPQSDTELLRYFHDREVWLLKADIYPQRVVRYPGFPEEPTEDTRSSHLTTSLSGR